MLCSISSPSILRIIFLKSTHNSYPLSTIVLIIAIINYFCNYIKLFLKDIIITVPFYRIFYGGNTMDKLVINSRKFSGKTQVVSVRFPADIVESLDSICTKTDRSRNELIVMMVDFALKHIEVVDE